jgi:hypothetical protein
MDLRGNRTSHTNILNGCWVAMRLPGRCGWSCPAQLASGQLA